MEGCCGALRHGIRMFLLAARCCSTRRCTAQDLLAAGGTRSVEQLTGSLRTGLSQRPLASSPGVAASLSGERSRNTSLLKRHPMAKDDWRASRGSTRLDAAGKGVSQMGFYMKRKVPPSASTTFPFEAFLFPPFQRISICFLNKQAGKSTKTLYASHGFVSQWLDHVSADQSTWN